MPVQDACSGEPSRGSRSGPRPSRRFNGSPAICYVGSKDLASYLIVTPQGDHSHQLQSRGLGSADPPQCRALGFQFTGTSRSCSSATLISIMTAAGSAEIIRETGAKYMVMDGDVPVVESGGAKDFAYPADLYPPARVDRVLHDGGEVKLGETVLVAHKTSGHTRGCTTWTLRVTRLGGTLNVVIVGSWNVNPGFRLVDRPGQSASYPGIAEEYRRTFAVLKAFAVRRFFGRSWSLLLTCS